MPAINRLTAATPQVAILEWVDSLPSALIKVLSFSLVDLVLFSHRKKVHSKGVNYVVGSLKAQLTNQSRVIPTERQLCRA
ncbi:hypothetical protein GCM10027578_15690 [Spirosoma luteolum]